MKLDAFLASRGIRPAEFSSTIGVSRAALARYLSGDRTPERRVMQRIVDATAGAVTPNDFYAMGDDGDRKAAAARWRKANREAIAQANDELARNGLWSDGLRLF